MLPSAPSVLPRAYAIAQYLQYSLRFKVQGGAHTYPALGFPPWQVVKKTPELTVDPCVRLHMTVSLLVSIARGGSKSEQLDNVLYCRSPMTLH